MQRFGHDFIDVLKIDVRSAPWLLHSFTTPAQIESYEFQLFDAILADYRDRPLPFGQVRSLASIYSDPLHRAAQLQIEIHANLQTFSSFYRCVRLTEMSSPAQP